MGRTATLNPSYQQSKKRWLVSVPPRLSKTGKRSQEYFQTKKEAESRANSLKKLEKENGSLAGKASVKLIQEAVELDELAKIHGFAGLREAFMTWADQHERKNKAISLAELVQAHEDDKAANWSQNYFATRWKTFRKKVESIGSQSIALMDTDFWRAWMAEYSKRDKPAPATYNQILTTIRSVFSHEKARRVHERNPLDDVPKLRNVRNEVCVSTPQEVKALLEWCWQNDRELVPYFALGYFAGMRPQSELEKTKFEQINLDERLIDCITTKTHHSPRRQIPIEDNLFKWLIPFSDCTGLITPRNFHKRYVATKKQTAIQWGHDIMRHSYGSYFEAM